jgi:hypothetical protein
VIQILWAGWGAVRVGTLINIIYIPLIYGMK